MGNALIVTGGHDGLAIVAVAKHLHLTEQQLLLMRQCLYQQASSAQTLWISRQDFQRVLHHCSIRKKPDQAILNHLFTMWDVNGNDHILWQEYLVAIAPLACPAESLADVLQFIMTIMDVKQTNRITSAQLVFALKNINRMAACFGDATLTLRQIHKIVDNVFETITFISYDPKDVMSHERCIELLLQDHLFHKAAFNKLNNVRFEIDRPKAFSGLRETLPNEMEGALRREKEGEFADDISFRSDENDSIYQFQEPLAHTSSELASV